MFVTEIHQVHLSKLVKEGGLSDHYVASHDFKCEIFIFYLYQKGFQAFLKTKSR